MFSVTVVSRILDREMLICGMPVISWYGSGNTNNICVGLGGVALWETRIKDRDEGSFCFHRNTDLYTRFDVCVSVKIYILLFRL
jgi:hypothetical protein